ncbi:metallophosphoesterase family protein [Roseococcus sp. DSY-14]|uniref:metallophosphoesterase family protein n=1 Tax=Roseococcus sp. DSY-14 TaxID=3369650 RepID=UPI00387B2F68
MTRLAILADIHGNLPALEAVLADIAATAPDAALLDLGDSVSGPLWPREVLALLRARAIPSLRGNHDRWVAQSASPGATDAFARQAVGADGAAWLDALPALRQPAPGLVAFHARPDDDDAYLLEDVRDGALHPARPDVVAARLAGLPPGRLVLCAHSHRAALLALPDGRVVLNPGSVGMPAYADPTPPHPHVSEAGSPHARYALAEVAADGAPLRVELRAIAYGWQAAADRAAALGRTDWARWLGSGFAG